MYKNYELILTGEIDEEYITDIVETYRITKEKPLRTENNKEHIKRLENKNFCNMYFKRYDRGDVVVMIQVKNGPLDILNDNKKICVYIKEVEDVN